SPRSGGRKWHPSGVAFFGLALGDPAEAVAEVVHLLADGLAAGQLGLAVALLADQLPADLGGRQPGVQPLAGEGRVSLALAVDEGADVGQQAGQVPFGTLAAASGEGIDATDAAGQLMQPFADGAPVPAQLALGAALAIDPQQLDGSGKEQPPVCPTQGFGCLPQVVLDRLGQFHNYALRGGAKSILWDDYFPGSALLGGRGVRLSQPLSAYPGRRPPIPATNASLRLPGECSPI